MNEDALLTLQALGEQMRARLLELPEYRALMAIERTIREVAGILEQARAAGEPARPAPPPSSVEAAPRGAGALRQEAAAGAFGGVGQSRMAAAIAEAISTRTGPLAQGSRPPARYGATTDAA